MWIISGKVPGDFIYKGYKYIVDPGTMYVHVIDGTAELLIYDIYQGYSESKFNDDLKKFDLPKNTIDVIVLWCKTDTELTIEEWMAGVLGEDMRNSK